MGGANEHCISYGASLSEPRIHEIQEVALYVYIYIYLYICGLWGDYFHDQRVKLRIANVGNGRQTRVHLDICRNVHGKQTKLTP